MTGRATVSSLRQRLESTFKRVSSIQSDPELQSDFAKYLCILVSGYVESAVRELLLEHSRKHSGPTIQRYVERQTRRTTNFNSERLQQLLGNFDEAWRQDLVAFVVDEKKAALDSVVNLRNNTSGH